MFGPIGHTNTVSPWGPPPPTMVSGAGPSMGMPTSRPIYGSPDPMSCRMYGVNSGDHITDLDHDKQQQQQQQQQQPPQQQQQQPQQQQKDTEPDLPKVLFSPAPIMNVQKESKKKRQRKKSYGMPQMDTEPGQVPMPINMGSSGPLPGGASSGSSGQYQDMLGIGPIGPLSGGYGQVPSGPWGQAPPQMNSSQNNQGPGMGMMGMNNNSSNPNTMDGPGPTDSMSSDMYTNKSGNSEDTEPLEDNRDSSEQPEPIERKPGVIYSVNIVEIDKAKKEKKKKSKGEGKDREKGRDGKKKRRRKKKAPQRAIPDGEEEEKEDLIKPVKGEKGKSKVIFSSSVYNIVQKEVKPKRKKTKPKRMGSRQPKPVATTAG